MTTHETRREAHETIDKRKRYNQILEILDELGEATAKEIAVRMCEKGFTTNTDRGNAAPRLTEMEWNAITDSDPIYKVKVVGKKKCAYTGRTVAVYGRA